MLKKIRVRFAPSPTGPLHIGGLRTALFNYLFAKKNNGDFVLRIEDTDQKRYVTGSEKHIIDSLDWCGLTINEGPTQGGNFGPYRQSERKELYRSQIEKLVSLEKAYYAFDTREELEKVRLESEKDGKVFIYNAHNRHHFKNSLTLNKEKTAELLKRGDYTVRFKTPKDKEITCYDVLRGKVVLSSSLMDDKVLYKSDGNPTYHFANVIDDHEMNISHVIRGEEWLPSLALHWLLYDAFDWTKPKFVHLPLILKPTGKGKLSKRDGAKFGFPVYPLKWTSDDLVISGYKESGFMPEATINFLALLGWNPGTEKEVFTLKQLEKEFSLKNLNNSGARFDPEKNIWFNQQHMLKLEGATLINLLEECLKQNKIDYDFKKLDSIIRLIRPRLDLLTSILPSSIYFFMSPKNYNAKAINKICDHNSPQTLFGVSTVIENIGVFKSTKIKLDIENYAKGRNLGFGKVLGLIRLAIVGELSGPDLFETIEIVGQTASIKRIKALANFLP